MELERQGRGRRLRHDTKGDDKMKVLAITGSPRENGNTQFFTQVALTELEQQGVETELISLIGKTLSPCTGCYRCIQAKRCVIEDDFQPIFDKMAQADGLIFGSPAYHASITPMLKAVLDRAGFSGRWAANDMKEKGQSYTWQNKGFFSGKVGAGITVARRAGHCFSYAQLLMWLTVNDFIVVGSNYWNVGMAGKGGTRDGADDAEGIGTMQHMARNMAHVMKQLQK